jgi:hypothetical protein
VTFTHAAHKPTHNNKCDPLSKSLGTPGLEVKIAVIIYLTINTVGRKGGGEELQRILLYFKLVHVASNGLYISSVVISNHVHSKLFEIYKEMIILLRFCI